MRHLHSFFPLLCHLLSALLLTVSVSSFCNPVLMSDSVQVTKVKELSVARLPDLNIPRSTHCTLVINGEFVTFGGHTAGFIPTPTAEYYRDGAWHVMNMVYAHDGGLVMPLRSGKVLLAGGFEKNLGIGQTFVVEYYDPTTHTFQGFGCLDQKRAFANGVELDSGRVIISGNWYDKDAIEQFDGRYTFSFVKNATTERSRPYMLRISRDNILIFNNFTNRNRYPEEGVIVDQLQGEPFSVPLFNEWKPLHMCEQGSTKENWSIGEEEKGIYAYLIPVRKTTGEMGLVHVQDTTFTLLPLQTPIPTTEKNGIVINYCQPLVIDRAIQRAYLIGYAAYRTYCIGIDYAKRPATVTVGYTDSIPAHGSTLTLTPNGDILVLGGIYGDIYNFSPLSLARLIKVGRPDAEETLQQGATNTWLWIVLILLTVVVVIAVILLTIRKRKGPKQQQPLSPDIPSVKKIPEAEEIPVRRRNIPDDELMAAIYQIMEEHQAYLNSDLKLSDMPALVHTNGRYVSDSIKRTHGCSFSHFVNTYRIRHAQQLLLANPVEKVAIVAIKSGFANETSFFRTFKSLTGLTPREWIQAQNISEEPNPEN